MQLPRIQSFEFNDHPSVPKALRDTVVETLGNTLDWGGIIKALVPSFREFLHQTKSNAVLDLCSGSGTPARILVEELHREGHETPRFNLTDLFPYTEEWKPICLDSPYLDFVAEPVDATQISPQLSDGKSRVMINSFHHFSPALAKRILADTIGQKSPFFLAEGFQRNPFQFLNFAPTGLLALYLNPLLTKSKSLQKALWTWPLPLAALASTWDGFVSTMRVYSKEELMEMVKGSEKNFDWTYGVYRYPPLGTGYYFYGIPVT